MGRLSSIAESTVNFFSKKPVDNFPEALVFHIHGGGFISMSSFIHQIYTRVWANEL
jgi:hypothetical protein